LFEALKETGNKLLDKINWKNESAANFLHKEIAKLRCGEK